MTSTTSTSRLTLILCPFVAGCEGFDLQAAGVAAVGIAAQMQPTPNAMGTFFAAGTFGLFIGALLGGRMADLVGRRLVLIYSILTFGLFTLLTAFAWSMQSLNWARFLTGLGLGGALPVVMTMVSEASRPERRLTNTAAAFAALPAGGAVASAVALFVSPARWPLLFVIGGLVPLALSLALWRLLQESAEWTALRMSPQITVGNPSQIGSFRHTVTHGRALSSVLLWISFFLALVVLYLLLNWLPTLLKDNGMSSRQAASAQILFNVGGALAALSMGRLLTGRWRLVALLSVSVAVPLTLYALSQIGHAFLAAAIVVLLLGMSMLALQAYLYSTAPASYPTWLRGVGVGTALAMGRLGSIAGPKLGGWLKELGHGPSQLLLELVPIAIVASVITLMLALIQRRIPTATN